MSIRRLVTVFELGALALLVVGCGGDGSGDPAPPQTSLPQVVTIGGTVLTTPKVLPILYSADPNGGDVMAFLQELSSSGYWSQTTSEYGVGPLTLLPPISIATAPPATVTDAMLESMLADNTTGPAPAWGAADPGTIYLFVLPPGMIESDAEGACCTAYDGYHYETNVGTDANPIQVPYALSCACSGFDGPAVTDLQERTIDMSHELVETATDPFPDTDPAFTQEDDADIVWTFVTDGEVADMCEFADDANVIPPGATYMVQRSWSNAAAARFENPCVPVTSTTPYLNSFPQLATINYAASGSQVVTQGEHIALGQTKTIDVVLRSAARVAQPWSVQAYDYDEAIAGSTAALDLKQDKQSGLDGDTLHLTITPTSQDSYLGGEAFIIWSDFGTPGTPEFESQLTMGLVTN